MTSKALETDSDTSELSDDERSLKEELSKTENAMEPVNSSSEAEDEEDSDEESDDHEEESESLREKIQHLKNTLKSIQDPESSSSEDEEEEEEMEQEKDSGQSDIEDSSEGDEKNDPDNTSSPKKSNKVEAKENDEDNDELRSSIRAELKQMSLEEIQALKEKIGLKLYNQALSLDSSGRPIRKRTQRSKEEFKRINKNRPREVSSKKPASRFRDVVGIPGNIRSSKEKRDPRFDAMCGDYDPKQFRDSYKFVSAIREKEQKKLKQELADETDPERKKQIKYLIQRFDNQERERKRLEAKESNLAKDREKNKELVKQGLKPVFKSKAERKNEELVAKFEELKKKGTLDKYLKRKNKSQAAKVSKIVKR